MTSIAWRGEEWCGGACDEAAKHDSSEQEAPQSSEAPPRLHGWALTRRIGQGASGHKEVWLGRRGSSKPCAVSLRRLDSISLDDAAKELRLLSGLRHANVAAQSGGWWSEDRWLISAAPLAEWGSAADVGRRGFPDGLPELAVAHVISGVLGALSYLHTAESVVHRGVRAAHVLVYADGSVRLGGFRLALRLKGPGKRSHDFGAHLSASLLWLGPEVLAQSAGGYGTASDLYSLGVLAVELANGFPPFSDMDRLQMLMEKLRGTTPRLLDSTTTAAVDDFHRRSFSKAFHRFTERCLGPEASRASLAELRSSAFLAQLRGASAGGLKELLAARAQPLQA